MDPQLLFNPLATLQAETERRRASASIEPTAVPPGIADSTTSGLPAIGASGLGLAGSGSGLGSSGGGGLGSSPNVPAPGTSINPATGLPHSAGLTRQELAAMKAQQEHARGLSELSGRQQAAAQLVGTGPVLAGTPASPTGGEKSVIDDVTQQISKLGHKTYDALPPAIKDVFAEPKGKGPEGSPVKPRRGSAAAMFENVKNTASRLSHDLQQTVSNAMAEPDGYHAPSSPAAAARRLSATPSPIAAGVRRESQIKPVTPATAGTETSVFQQVKGFLSEAFEAPPAGGYPADTATTNRTLPSQENQGARPGEVSAGAGALPGKAGEAGVAVPPDVRAQEGTDNGHIATSTAAPTGFSGGGSTFTPPAPIPVPVSAIDAGAFGATFLPPPKVTNTGGPAHANVPLEEKTEVEKVVENLADKAKNLLGFGSSLNPLGVADKDRRGSGSDPIADGAVGAAFGMGTLGNTTLGQTRGDENAARSGSLGQLGEGKTGTTTISTTTGLSDLAPPIPATQTGVLTESGTNLAPTSAPAGVSPGVHASHSSAAHASSAPASGTATPVPRAGALGAGTSDAILTPSEAAVAAQATSYMDAHPETGKPAEDDEAGKALAGLGAGGAGALAGVGAATALAGRNDDADKTNMAVGPDEDKARAFASVPPNERLDSLASVTAIRHGQLGDLHNGAASGVSGVGSSPLATVSSADEEGRGQGQKSTTRGTGPNHTTSLTPGGEHGSIGHPATVDSDADAKRSVGTYPAAQHEDAVKAAIKEHVDGAGSGHGHGPGRDGEKGLDVKVDDHDKKTGVNGSSASTSASASAPATSDKSGTAAPHSPTTASAGRSSLSNDRATPKSPAAAVAAENSSGHRRASSSASTDSKKVGFMKKLKGEMKVISGKLGNNEEKVILGEKIKHGEA